MDKVTDAGDGQQHDGPAEVGSCDSSEPARSKPTKNRGGAPAGNVNAARDPEFQLRMRDAQRLAKRGRRNRQVENLADALELVEQAGLGGTPAGDYVARRVAMVENEIAELEAIVQRSGRTRRDGSLTPPYERLLMLLGQDRAELRQLVEQLAEVLAAKGGGERTIRIVFDEEGRA